MKLVEQRIIAADLDAPRTIEKRLGGKTAFEDRQANRHVDPHRVFLATKDANGNQPRKEFRIILDIRNQIEQLRRRVSQMTLLPAGRHAMISLSSNPRGSSTLSVAFLRRQLRHSAFPLRDTDSSN